MSYCNNDDECERDTKLGVRLPQRLGDPDAQTLPQNIPLNKRPFTIGDFYARTIVVNGCIKMINICKNMIYIISTFLRKQTNDLTTTQLTAVALTMSVYIVVLFFISLLIILIFIHLFKNWLIGKHILLNGRQAWNYTSINIKNNETFFTVDEQDPSLMTAPEKAPPKFFVL